MGSPAEISLKLAGAADAGAIGHLLHDFNTEFDDPTPTAEWLAARIATLLADDDTDVLLAGEEPVGLAVMRFRPALWSDALECYLAELYVVPARRGEGIGRALMRATIEHARGRGADRIELGTGEQDVAARGLYESLGFDNREGKPDGAINYFYEREV